MKAMYTFRFNPVFQQWVMVGGAVIKPHQVKEAHYLDSGRQKHFLAVSYPRQPFLLEPARTVAGSDTLFREQSLVGEYELLLYKGTKPFEKWQEAEWEAWLQLLQHRITQAHQNPHLHYLHFTLRTTGLETIEDYTRAGDLIATSHPITGILPGLSIRIAEKIANHDSIFCLNKNKYGSLYVPAAPMFEQEVWYIPNSYTSGIETIGKVERSACAKVLAILFAKLKEEFSHREYILTIGTSMAENSEETTWWIQIHADIPDTSILPVRSLPEGFVSKMHVILGKAF